MVKGLCFLLGWVLQLFRPSERRFGHHLVLLLLLLLLLRLRHRNRV